MTVRSLGYGIRGPAGAKGETGAAGISGTPGAQGPAGPAGTPATNPATLLGTITISETATVAITAGARRVTVTTPLAWGVVPGQNLLIFPVSVPSGAYATHDVIPTAANTLSIGVTAPLLAVMASYTIQCRLVRINT